MTDRYLARNSGRTRRTGARPTINDVAAQAGVARGTVSRVLNGSGYVSAAARRTVLTAIRETGYSVNTHARSLVTGRCGSVAVILSTQQIDLFEDPQFCSLLRECTRILADNDLSLALEIAVPPGSGPLPSSGRADAAIVVSACSTRTVVERLRAAGVPLVLCGRPMWDAPAATYVAVDDRGGARDIVAHLRGTGRRRIAALTGPDDTPAGHERLAGYHDAVGGRAGPVIAGSYRAADCARAVRRALARRPDIDAIFAASAPAAVGALDALHRTGRLIPHDVAVGAFDDAVCTRPALTTIRQPTRQIAAELVRLALEQIDGGCPLPVILPTQLIVREST